MRESTKNMFKKHGWRVDRGIHNYIYFVFYYPYVTSVFYLFKALSIVLFWFKPLNLVLKTAFSRYHSKVLTYNDTKKFFTIDHDIIATSHENKKIVPYKYAHKIILQEPQHLAVMDCPCKKALKDEDWTINSCIAVGKGISSFWIDHGEKYNAKKITQTQALELIENFRKHGYLTQAFFKVATGGSTGVICNCHPDTCVSLKATRFAKKFSPKLSMQADSGYSITHDDTQCIKCGDCAGVCPTDAIRVEKNKSWSYDISACLGCELCAEHCPKKAISLVRDLSKTVPLDLDLVEKEYIRPN